MAPPDPSYFVLAGEVLAALEGYYPAAPDGMALPERRYVSAGLPAWDCEQVTVRILRVLTHIGNLVAEVPVVLEDPGLRAVDIEIEIVRCCPTVESEGDEISVPAVEDEDASAQAVLTDAATVEAALFAAIEAGELGGCRSAALLSWTPKGPDGGLVAGTTVFRLGVD